MEYRISATYLASVKVWFEISVDADGDNYLVIYGNHINGGFCCIPNWNIACEMGKPSDIFYNAEALVRSKLSKKRAKAISEAIFDKASALGM